MAYSISQPYDKEKTKTKNDIYRRKPLLPENKLEKILKVLPIDF